MKSLVQPVALPAEAMLSAALLAVDPAGLGGLSLRGRSGPAQIAWLDHLWSLLPPETVHRRLPLHIADDRLLGGLDLAATLRAGRPVVQRGLLADCDGGWLVLPMAERSPPALAAKLAGVMDAGAVVMERDGLTERHATRFGLILLDEGIDADEVPPAGLLDRLALQIDLDGMESGATADDLAETALADITVKDIAAAQRRLPSVIAEDDVLEALGEATLALGISSARPLRFAVNAARAAAALFDRSRVGQDETVLAARLVLSPRARQLPAQDEETTETSQEAESQAQDTAPPQPPEDPGDTSEAQPPAAQSLEALETVVLAATKAAIPANLLARLKAGAARRSRDAASGKAGQRQASQRRGRPAGTRRGQPKPGQRLNLLGTLRAAAPWQVIRRREAAQRGDGRSPVILIQRDDFRVSRFKHRLETTTIFVVDASGSTALHRLAEAKGAVELLLADCYVRRDSVALLTFSGREAQLLLPPTRSLTRAKRCLAGLPAGGGTPLATAIEAAAELADNVRRKGRSPTLVFLTDGRGNIAKDGTADRETASRDTLAAARHLAEYQMSSLLVDISPRARPLGHELATAMGARYLALPHADAATLSSAVGVFAQADQPKPGKGR